MDTGNLPPLPGLERISSSCSTSSICTTSTMSSSVGTVLPDEYSLCLDYQLSYSESATPTPPTTTTGATKRRKRQNSAMIIKPARWSPPVYHNQPTQSQQHPDTNRTCNEKNRSSNSISAIDTADFKPTFYNPNEIKHRRRISTHQCSVLEEEYHTNSKPSATKRHQLAEQLDMTPRTVQIWFQNKRAKAKQHQQQQQQQKNNPALSPTCHHATPPPNSTISSTTAKSEPSTISLSSTTAMPLDMFTFDDGRLDPIYLIDDHSVATVPSSSVSSPSVSKCGTMLPVNEGDHDVAAVVAPMAGVYDTDTMDGHGTMKLAPPPPTPQTKIVAAAAAPVSSSPLLSSSETTGTSDAFTMWPHHPNDTTTHSLPPQDTLPSFSSATTSSSSTPLQPFSSLDLFSVLQPYQQSHDAVDSGDGRHYKSMINNSINGTSLLNLYSIAEQTENQQQPESQQQQHQQQHQPQQHCHDCSFGHLWTQKQTTDPGFGASMISTWPYMMNQHVIQNDYLDFVLDQDDWMGPFYASA